MAKKIIDYKGYKATIGIECHVQLKTKTKLFSGSLNNVKDSIANQQINHIDLGLPGALPVLNQEAIILAIKAGYALHTTAQIFSKFDRKHYFYPDLPMGYQITQYDQPIIVGGYIDIVDQSVKKRIGITRAHLEADAGKSMHPAGKDYSLLDFNRAGVPLLEIVSEPDMSTPLEARLYASELYLAMKLANVSDANLFFGNMRFDCNVSLSKTAKLGTRTEIKNLNSFRSVEKALEAEIIRQIEILEKGGRIIQETRGWDEAKQKGFTQRVKENADDYRYMPDPDLPPIVLDPQLLEDVKKSMPVLADEWRQRLQSLQLTSEEMTMLLKAEADLGGGLLDSVYQVMDDINQANTFANWLINIEIPFYQKNESINELRSLTTKERLNIYQEVYRLKQAGLLNSNRLNDLLSDLLVSKDIKDIEGYAKKQGYIQQSDKNSLLVIVDQVIKDNPKAVQDVLDGQQKALGFLVGQVMKLSKGQANPQISQQLLSEQIFSKQ